MLGALLVAMVAGIGGLLVVLSDANDRIHAQDAKIASLQADAEPLLEAVAPLVRETRPFLRRAGDLTGPLSQTAADVSAVADATPPVLRGARLLIGESLPLVDLLRLTLPEIRAGLPELRGFLPRADAGVGSVLEIEQMQREALRIQREQFELQRQTLATQTEALEHIRSIDEKTGGDLTP